MNSENEHSISLALERNPPYAYLRFCVTPDSPYSETPYSIGILYLHLYFQNDNSDLFYIPLSEDTFTSQDGSAHQRGILRLQQLSEELLGRSFDWETQVAVLSGNALDSAPVLYNIPNLVPKLFPKEALQYFLRELKDEGNS